MNEEKREINIMTLEEFINNPTGKNTSFMGSRDVMRASMKEKFDNVKSRIKYKVYTKGDVYFFHFSIPSEKLDDFYFDVVLELYPETEKIAFIDNLKDYNIRFFSNMHSFVYTYANVVYKNDLGVRGLEHKYPKQVMKKEPVEKNPIHILGFEKSIYYSALYIEENLLHKSNIKVTDKIKSIKDIEKNIKDFEAIESKYKVLSKKLADEIREEKNLELKKKNIGLVNKVIDTVRSPLDKKSAITRTGTVQTKTSTGMKQVNAVTKKNSKTITSTKKVKKF